MTDALSAIAQDENLASQLKSLLAIEAKLLSGKLSNKKLKELMKAWADYSRERTGFNLYPRRGTARRHIVALGQYIEKEIPLEYLRVRLAPPSPNSYHNYFAVGEGCHGRMMNNLEDPIALALEKKFTKVPHSFRLIVEDSGRIDFERITCGACPQAAPCSIRDRCNCCNPQEYAQVEQKQIEDRQAVQRISIKYHLNL